MKISLHLYAVILLAGILLFSGQCRQKEKAAASLTTSGMIEAIQTDVRSLTTGEVKELAAEEGQYVQPGDILCVLDSEKLSIQLEQVTAGLAGARSKLKLVEKGTKKELIEVAKNQLEAAEKEYETAKKNQERVSRLYQDGAVSQTQKEKTDLALKAAQERFESAQENYRLAVRGREQEEIEMVQAEIQSLEAQARLLRKQIEDATVISPVRGTLTTRYIELGELALPNTLLFSIIDLSRSYVKAYIPERYIGRVALGNEVSVESDSLDQLFKGRVDFISDRAEFSPKNVQTKEERLKLVYMIKSYLDNEDRTLKPGMPVDVTIILDIESP